MQPVPNYLLELSDNQIEQMIFDLFEYGDLEQYINYLDELCYEFVSNSDLNGRVKGEIVIFTSRMRKILVAANVGFEQARNENRLEKTQTKKSTTQEGKA